MDTLPTTPLVHTPGHGRALWHLGALLQFKALMEETSGQFWALEGLADRHMAVPLHAHSREDEIWFVLEGQISFTVGDTWPTPFYRVRTPSRFAGHLSERSSVSYSTRSARNRGALPDRISQYLMNAAVTHSPTRFPPIYTHRTPLERRNPG
jgi:hypothetical protein